MFIDETTSRTDLEVAILNDRDLYARFDEQKFLNAEYTDAELLAGIRSWIEEGDECAAA